MKYTQVIIDMENNAETFWGFLAGTDIPDEFKPIVAGLDSSTAEGVLVSPPLASRFQAWVAGLPGYADGPAHAPEALLFYEGRPANNQDLVIE